MFDDVIPEFVEPISIDELLLITAHYWSLLLITAQFCSFMLIYCSFTAHYCSFLLIYTHLLLIIAYLYSFMLIYYSFMLIYTHLCSFIRIHCSLSAHCRFWPWKPWDQSLCIIKIIYTNRYSSIQGRLILSSVFITAHFLLHIVNFRQWLQTNFPHPHKTEHSCTSQNYEKCICTEQLMKRIWRTGEKIL